jgi:hypothetical protein
VHGLLDQFVLQNFYIPFMAKLATGLQSVLACCCLSARPAFKLPAVVKPAPCPRHLAISDPVYNHVFRGSRVPRGWGDQGVSGRNYSQACVLYQCGVNGDRI